jgi:glucose/arabinose dehydrogenase
MIDLLGGIMRSTQLALLVSTFAFTVVPACSSGGPYPADKPELGKADSGDEPDRLCRIVLREVKSLGEGVLDVDTVELDNGGSPVVMFTFDGIEFLELRNLATVDGGVNGYQRFKFEIPDRGGDQVEIIPYLKVDGGRLFDHNRNPGDLDNYIATRGAGFTVALDEQTCPDKLECQVPGLALERAYAQLSLLDVTAMHWEPNVPEPRVYVVEKNGRILSFPDRNDVRDTDVTTVLDWRNTGATRDPEKTYNRGGRFGNTASGWEEGFLDMAFHPDWPGTPEVYVTYNTGLGDPEAGGNAQWNLTRFSSTDGGRTLDPSTRKVLIKLEKRGLTHNGGRVVFHPTERLLYVSIGTDGGFPFDPQNNGQNPATLFGSILRIDIDRDKAGVGYGIPPSNPFVNGVTPDGKAARPEVWAYGVRNPWRMNFDALAPHDLWDAEVGENAREEVNIIERGANYGYNLFEGDLCTFRGRDAVNCNNAGLTDPLFVLYSSDTPGGALAPGAQRGDSITGGYVYRGASIPNLQGLYVFGDFIRGEIFAYQRGTAQPVKLFDSGQPISTFAQDPSNELYFVAHLHQEQTGASKNGEIYKLLDAACQQARPGVEPDYVFLGADGAGSDQIARTYYKTILPNRDIDTYTLADWKADYVGAMPIVEALYKNEWDLNFWRQMKCTSALTPGAGGCCVTNWREEADAGNPNSQPDLGTVCMNVASVAEGSFTRFYVFGPDTETHDVDSKRKLQTFAVLDDEKGDGLTEDDKKYVPNLCTPCHGGIRFKPGGSADIGSVFREFEPSLLTPGALAGAAYEQRLFDLNQIALGANQALGVETPMIDYIENRIYPTGAPPSRSVFDEAPPVSWNDLDPDARAVKEAMWKDVVNPFCMGCHRVRKEEVNFEAYERLEKFGLRLDGVSQLERHSTGDYRDPPDDHPIWMPQTQFMFDRFNDVGDLRGGNAQVALSDWLNEVNNTMAAESCAVTFVTNGPDFTFFGQNAVITGQVGAPDSGELGRWDARNGLELDGVLFPQWSGTINLPQGALLEYKATVVDSFSGNVTFETGFNHVQTIPSTGPGCAVTFETDYRE